MIPVALAAIAVRQFATSLITRWGYRRFLVRNTVALGFLIAAMSLIHAGEPAWIRLLQLVAFGALNSLQFSAMNSLTLMDLESTDTGAGNSMLSMTQMLAMSFGVANAGALLTTFKHYFSADGGAVLQAFHATFVCMGLITCLSTWIFAQLPSSDHSRVH